MELLHETGRRKSPSGKWTYRYALFFCGYCKQSVEREASLLLVILANGI